ncbi:AraC family transcriptional regulator [Micromonospora sp. WMMA1363]|uniref:AraC family transcriptional regulator n=1 Tax=Micromonospora sp. WMMA1363 TaxID=3053985 RepID=UPI00259CF59B|nr:AraC family transcriptional regulator [Micromonospora sp. WMMA1363]MDM4718908.1 AraC family transcriptional regulator [Micromonospora sp. WMMA1363]
MRVDVLGDVLALARVDASLMATFDARAPWAIELPARQGASFHAVVAGTCWLTVDGMPPRRLAPGDLVLLPAGARHELATDPDLPTRRFDAELKRSLIQPDGELMLAGPGARTRILCAGYSYEAHAAHPVLSLLPPVLQVATAQPKSGPWLRTVLDLLAHETRGGAATGSDTAAVRLLDLLLIHVIRAWLDTGGDAVGVSWLRGLRDPVTARALAALHQRPGHDWTLDALAATVNVSRATLARRFTHHVGEPPLTYLNRWRLNVAAHKLRNTTLQVAAIAHEIGYTSEFAFNRAFARAHGHPPGRYRRHTQRADC